MMTPIQRIRAALDAHSIPGSPISKADCLAEVGRIVADVERIDALVAQNDAVKIDILRASIMNIGRLLPDNMSATFVRRGAVTTLEQVFPDGQTQTYAFRDHTPIYGVPVVPAMVGINGSAEGEHEQG